MRGARGLERSHDLGDDPFAVADLPENAGLHVVDDKRQTTGIAGLFEGTGNREAVQVLHDSRR